MARALGKVEVVDRLGNVVSGASVDLLDPTTLTRITDTVFADNSSATTLSLPLTTDSNGKREFYLTAGRLVLARYAAGGINYDDTVNVVDPTAPASGGGTVAPHAHVEADVTGLPLDLDSKAALVHTHIESQVTNLTTDLAAKASTAHLHAEADTTNLVSDLAGREQLVNKGAVNGYASLDNAGHVPAAQLPGATVSRAERPFEDFGGKLSTETFTLASQTAAWLLARAASDAAGGLIITFGAGLYDKMPPDMELGNYMSIRGAGMFATRLRADPSVNTSTGLTRDSAHKWIYNHVSTNGTTDPNATAVHIEDMWLDMGQVTGSTTDCIYLDRNPQFGAGATSDTLRAYNSAYQDMFHIVRNVFISRSPRDGCVSASMGAQHWENIQAYSCGRNGFRTPFDSSTIDCTAGFAGKSGFFISGTPARISSCKAYSCGNGGTGVEGHGFEIDGISQASVTLTNCESQDNFGHGYSVNNCSNGAVSLIGCWADSNSVGSAGGFPGFNIYGSPGTGLIGCRSMDRLVNGVSTQTNGITVDTRRPTDNVATAPPRASTNIKLVGFEHRAQNGSTVGAPFAAIAAGASFSAQGVNLLGGLQAPAFAASFTPDFYLGGIIELGLITANLTVNAPANGPYPPGTKVVLSLKEDTTGGWTVTWNGVYLNTPTIITTANARNTIRFFFDGTSWIGM